MPDWKTGAAALAFVAGGWCFMYGIIWVTDALGLLA